MTVSDAFLMERMPISKLKANLAASLARVKAGESFLITDRGLPVAVLEPLGWDLDSDERLKALVLSGVLSPPTAELGDDFFRRPRVKRPRGSLRAGSDKAVQQTGGV